MLSGTSQSSVSRKRIVLWSPHQTNQFVVGASDLRLYEYKNTINNSYNNTHNNNSLLNNVSSNSINFNNNNNNKLINSANSLKNSNILGGVNNNSSYNHQQHHQNNTSNSNNNISFDIQYPPDDWIPEDRKSVELRSVNNDVQYLKCMAWCPDQSDINLLACGLVNGRTVLTSFSSVNRIVKEFVPKHTRPCNTIAWNPINRSHIAVGLDKVRNDNSTLVWDINYLSKPKHQQQQQSSFLVQNNNYLSSSITSSSSISQIDAPHAIQQVSENGFSTTPLEPPETINQPVSEFTLSEATLALAWIPNNPFCLIIGTGSKWLRIYDTRDTNTSHSIVAHAKSVCGVTIDPFDNNRIATMSEDNVVKIWDMRRFEDPVFSINTNYKSVQQIEWCPTRSGILATSGREKNTIKLWDIKASTYTAAPDYTKSPPRGSDRKSNLDQSIHSTSKPSKTHISSEVISSFSWHPTNECRMLTVSYTGIVEAITLNESIPVSWSPQGSLCFSFGKHCIEGPNKGQTLEPPQSTLEKLNNNDGRYRRDISQLMRERAIQGYSAIVEDNVNLSVSFDKDINFLWNWIQKIPNNLQTFRKKPIKPEEVQKENDYVGIQHILNENQSYLVSNSIETQNGFQIYKSGQRSLCMLICGWGFAPNQPLEFLLARLEKTFDFERATALAVFHLDIKRAISILYNGCVILSSQQQQVMNNIMKSQQSNNLSIQQQQQQLYNSLKERENQLRVLSIALAGFGDGGASLNQIWRETCRMTSRSFSNPYLKLCLEFLSTNMNQQESVKELIASMNESGGVSLVDRISLACRYLDQPDLLAFIDRQTNLCIEQGDLTGIVLTGLTSRGIDLLQHYVDRTSDIQTAALATSLLVPKIFRDKRAKNWLQIYSDLLDNWQCWHERAVLDIQLTSETPPSQIFARCGYCQNSFSFESVNSGSMVGRNAKVNSRAKVPCCPHCKQQLPRCCLCMMQMNCMVPSLDFKQSNKQQQAWTEGSEVFDEWFTWCQTCRHGGHASHLSEWFKDHIECPVTDCNCKCSSI